MHDQIVQINNKKIKLTNNSKMMFPGISKIEVIKYYYDMADTLLPHIAHRPLVLKRYPNGIAGQFFYQKECPKHAPEWVETFTIRHSDRTINYVVCNDVATLTWLVNLGCLEFHVWRSKITNINCPDIAVMDLDPAPGVSFEMVLKVAILVRQALNEFNVTCYPKTSGSKGLHIFIPLAPEYSFTQVTAAMKYIAETIEKIYPSKCTTQRTIGKRGSRIYLDYLQNSWGKTMAWQYSLRPLPQATVSTPLLWEEVDRGNINTKNYNIKSIFNRIEIYGDLYWEVLTNHQKLNKILDMIN